jgi:hypothetical protein
MRRTQCPYCNKPQIVTGYNRDDPILACGHILTIEQQLKRDEISEILTTAMTCSVYKLMRNNKLSYKDAVKIYLDT